MAGVILAALELAPAEPSDVTAILLRTTDRHVLLGRDDDGPSDAQGPSDRPPSTVREVTPLASYLADHIDQGRVEHWTKVVDRGVSEGRYRPLPVTDPGYPRRLREAWDAPPLLFCSVQAHGPQTEDATTDWRSWSSLGDAIDARPSLAIVGSRKTSDQVLQSTEHVASDLSASGIAIVSGLAVGVDSAAHRGALAACGYTAAVMGTGIDLVFPESNRDLAAEIRRVGTLVSQFAPPAPRTRTSFLLRNHVIAALSDASLIMDGDERSGSRYEVEQALDYGRPVFAWAPSLRHRRWVLDLCKQAACVWSSRPVRYASIWHARRVKVGRNSEDRAQIVDFSDRLVPELATPPAGGPGVCVHCATWTRVAEREGDQTAPSTTAGIFDAAFDGTAPAGASDQAAQSTVLCENCLEVRNALDREPLGLCVVSLYRKPSPLRDVLTRYKGRNDEDDPFDPACVPVVRSMLGRYLLDHGDHLAEVSGGFDGIVVVPSTDRTPPHPLEDLIDSLDLDLPRWPLLARGTGELGFRRPNREGYRVVMAHEPARVLLVDDVYTTGSRLNSAASALSRDGHETVAALVLARRINVEYAAEALQLWARATSESFDWQTSPRTVAT